MRLRWPLRSFSVAVFGALLLLGRPAACQPVLLLPTLRELMADPATLLKAQLRWIKWVGGAQPGEEPSIDSARRGGAPSIASAQRSGAPSIASAQRSGAPSIASAQRSGAPSIKYRQAFLLIEGGTAQYRDPNWAPGPVHLPYDLAQHRELVREILRSRLGPPDGAAGRNKGPTPDDRTLELWGRSSKGWEVVARWTLSSKLWRQRHKALFQLLEPLFLVPAKQ